MALSPTSSRPSSGGGGFTPVGCVLARDAGFTIHDAGNYDILWDALYDNLWDLDPLVSIPTGLGLTFLFNGTSSLIVPTVDGIWSLSYTADRSVDTAWAGSIRTGGIGINFPWVQQLLVTGQTNGQPFLNSTYTGPLSSGAQLTHQVATVTNAAATPYTCNQVFLSIVRHA